MSTPTAPLPSLDDAEVARLARSGDPAAVEAMASRQRFEAAWSGEWTSGPDQPMQPRRGVTAGASFNREAQRRQEFQTLLKQSKSGPKAQRRAAIYTLETRFNHSVT